MGDRRPVVTDKQTCPRREGEDHVSRKVSSQTNATNTRCSEISKDIIDQVPESVGRHMSRVRRFVRLAVFPPNALQTAHGVRLIQTVQKGERLSGTPSSEKENCRIRVAKKRKETRSTGPSITPHKVVRSDIVTHQSTGH